MYLPRHKAALFEVAVLHRFAQRAGRKLFKLLENEQTALAAREVANECMKHGVDADCFTADVSQFEECAEMVKRVMARWGSQT